MGLAGNQEVSFILCLLLVLDKHAARSFFLLSYCLPLAWPTSAQLQQTRLAKPQPLLLSPWCTAALPHSGFASQDFPVGCQHGRTITIICQNCSRVQLSHQGVSSTTREKRHRRALWNKPHFTRRMSRASVPFQSLQDRCPSPNGPNLNTDPLYLGTKTNVSLTRAMNALFSGIKVPLVGSIGADTNVRSCSWNWNAWREDIFRSIIPYQRRNGTAVRKREKVSKYAWAVYIDHHRCLRKLERLEIIKEGGKSDSNRSCQQQPW
ncbi:hypothetical protein F5146DRAFT_132381 [Armillaria mellea]|nr:hypothetical protein F5146DRAFT_132381 [Armillaria mellea]